jgi:hypothetical protein
MKTLLIILGFILLTFNIYGQYSTTDSTGTTFVNLNSLDNNFTCDSLDRLVKKYGSIEKIEDANLKILAIMAQIRCSVSMLNNLATTLGDSSHYQAQVLFYEDSKGNPKVLFNLIDLKTLKTAKKYADYLVDFAPMIITETTGPFGDILMKSGVVTAVGKYSVDAYYEAAIKDDPLIIFYPSLIPGKKFTMDVIKELSSNKVYNEVSKVWELPNKIVINPIAKIAKSGTKEVVRGTENVVKEIDRGGDRLWKEGKRFIKRL